MSDINVELQEDLNITQDADEINVELSSDLNIETASDTLNITTEDAQPINIHLSEILSRETETGASTFLELTDTPSSYTGQAAKLVGVNQAETGLEYVTPNPGDITGVTAGTGLSGGGTSGTVTLSLDDTHTDTIYLRKDQNLADLSDWAAAISELKLDSPLVGQGASLIGLQDDNEFYIATNVEGALTEIQSIFLSIAANLRDIADVVEARTNLGVYSIDEINALLDAINNAMVTISALASTSGAGMVGISDAAGEYTATTLEALIAELGTRYIRKTNPTQKDQGYEQNSSKDGITADYISDKTLHNIAIKGHPGTPQNGSIRVYADKDPDTFEIYLRDQWNTIIYDLTTENGDFRHTPLSEQIYVWRGDSVKLGLNGQPIIQEYKVSMGAFPAYRILSGGSF